MNISNPLSYLSGFLSEYPLYSLFGTDQPLEAEDLDHLQFNFFCKNENSARVFTLEATSYHLVNRLRSLAGNDASANGSNHEPSTGFTELYSGICQSCENYKIDIVVNAGIQKEKPKYFIRKIGQYPAPVVSEPKLPKQIHYFLNDTDRDFYGKALQSMESGYGTAALSYFRRIIDNEMKRIIETVSAYNSSSTKIIYEAVNTYKIENQRSKFIEATSTQMRPGFKEHGANILLLLYDALLTDIISLSEEECLKKSKDIDMMFRYMIRKITQEKPVLG